MGERNVSTSQTRINTWRTFGKRGFWIYTQDIPDEVKTALEKNPAYSNIISSCVLWGVYDIPIPEIAQFLKVKKETIEKYLNIGKAFGVPYLAPQLTIEASAEEPILKARHRMKLIDARERNHLLRGVLDAKGKHIVDPEP